MKSNSKRRPKRTQKPKFLLTRFTTKEKKSSFSNSNKTKKNKIKSKVIKN